MKTITKTAVAVLPSALDVFTAKLEALRAGTLQAHATDLLGARQRFDARLLATVQHRLDATLDAIAAP